MKRGFFVFLTIVVTCLLVGESSALAAWEYAESEAETTTTSTSFVTKSELVSTSGGTCLILASKEMKPDEAFTYIWASVLLDEVITKVKQGCCRDGKQFHWDLFNAHVLDPIITG